jgi:hypothetical protein
MDLFICDKQTEELIVSGSEEESYGDYQVNCHVPKKEDDYERRL